MRTWIGRLGAVVALLVSVVAVPSPASAQSTSVLVGVMVRHMTLEEKVGQLFVVEVYGQDATTVAPEAVAANQRLYGVDTPAQVIDKYKPGGVIYFTAGRGPDNLRNPRQIATLSNGLQAAAVRQRTRVPLLISTDQ